MWLRRSLPLAAPTRWQQAVAKLSPDKILPAVDTDQKFAAFLGDKILGATAAAWIRKSGESYDHSTASKLTATVLSNKFFADRIEIILPGEVYRNAANSISEHSVGTMVEAAVAATKDPEAVNDLVDWLMEEARDLDIVNAKGLLLELGGTVASERISGSDHSPVFRATASLEDATEEADGSTKKHAEQNAARKCLQILGYATSEVVGNETLKLDPPLNQWNHVVGEAMALKLKNNETMVDWWKRGSGDRKASFQRALLAPSVFPDKIISVDSWIRRSERDGDAAVLLAILYSKGGVNSCWSTTAVAPSGTLAKSAVGMEANTLIAEVVSIPLPQSTDN